MKKTLAFLFAGNLAKHKAGSRPLTDKERWNLLVMIWALFAQAMYYMLKANADQDDTPVVHNNRLLQEENRRLIAENNKLRAQSTPNPVREAAIRKYDDAQLPYTWVNIAKFYETELSAEERAAFGNDKLRFKDALTGK